MWPPSATLWRRWPLSWHLPLEEAQHLVHALAATTAGALELAGVDVEKDEATSEKNEELTPLPMDVSAQ